MHEFSRPLGDTVKRARGKLNMTQNEVAASANIDVRTVLNIENYKGNPKLEVLYPLVRKLNIDPNELFTLSCNVIRPHSINSDYLSNNVVRMKQ